jgi:hypothetical protein
VISHGSRTEENIAPRWNIDRAVKPSLHRGRPAEATFAPLCSSHT